MKEEDRPGSRRGKAELHIRTTLSGLSEAPNIDMSAIALRMTDVEQIVVLSLPKGDTLSWVERPPLARNCSMGFLSLLSNEKEKVPAVVRDVPSRTVGMQERRGMTHAKVEILRKILIVGPAQFMAHC